MLSFFRGQTWGRVHAGLKRGFGGVSAGNSRVLDTPSKSRKGVWCLGGHAALGLWTPQPVRERYGQKKARLGPFFKQGQGERVGLLLGLKLSALGTQLVLNDITD